MLEGALRISPEIRDALARNAPVVALESTLIAHGMPFPRNLEVARRLEAEVRAHGAVPATIAVMDGAVAVGLSDAEIERIAAGTAVKVSRLDLPIALSRRQTGATTVAATMICAHASGIRIFATGGIGGVHRGHGRILDISADLQELARTEVAVVCAGAKSVLDIPNTLEYLETLGVPVIGYRTERFPAFFTRDSGCPVHASSSSLAEIAEMLRLKWSLQLGGGAVIANPVPEADALDADAIDEAIRKALAEADDKGIRGKAITPFLLARIVEATGGRSLDANVALVLNNARVGAELAREFSARWAPQTRDRAGSP
jgi:pseudouridine-5'-phosphate glycosidase